MPSENNTPAIRFAGFTEEWERRNFGNITSRLCELSSERSLPRVEYEDIISERGVLNKDIKLKKCHKTGIRFDHQNVLYGKLRPYLHNWLLPEFTGIAVGDFWVLLPQGVDRSFLFALIQSSRFDNVANQSTGTKMPRADWKLVSKSKFLVPVTIGEQHQIGRFIYLIEKCITLHRRKCELLETLKKSMLEKLFPKEGELVPELRFSGFTGEWERRKLGDLADVTTGKLDANAMTRDGEYDFYTCSLQVYKTDQYAFEGPAITVAGNGYVGCLHLADGKFNAYQRTYVLSNFGAIREYLYEELGNKLPAKVNQEARSGNIPYIVRDMLTELQVLIPNNEEQRYVARLFQFLDTLLTLHRRKLEHLQNIKKACLEKMFI